MSAPSEKTRTDLLLAFSAQVAYKAFAFIILALMARHTTKDDFGQLMFVFALCSMALLLSELGTSNYLVREIASAPQRALRQCRIVLGLRLPMIVFLVGAVNLFVYIKHYELIALTLLISIYLAQREVYATFAALFVGLQRIGYTVVAFGGAQLVLLGLVAWMAAVGAGVLEFAAAHTVCGLCMVLLSVALTRQYVGTLQGVHENGAWRGVLSASLPLFGLTTLALLQLRIDTLMLGYLGNYGMVALYEAAARLFEGSQFLIRPLTLILFPICSALVVAKRYDRLRAISLRLAFGALALGVAVATAVAASAEPLLVLMYGDRYDQGAPALRVLFLSAPALYLSVVMSFVCVSLRVERTALLAFAACVLLNVVLNAYLIPAQGAQGAALATLISLYSLTCSLGWISASVLLRDRGRTSGGFGVVSAHTLRIAVVAACPFPAPRGTPIRILRLAEALAHRGHDVSVVTYHLGDRAAELPFQVHRIARVPAYAKTSPGPSVRKIVQLDPMLALKLKAVIDAEPVDIIHAHHYEGLLASSWARPPCPIIYDAHTTLGSELPTYGRVLPSAAKRWAGGFLDWRLPRRAAHTVAVTPSIRDYLINIGAVGDDDVTVISNGVELASFERCEALQIDDDKTYKVLAYAGNLAPYQRVDLMLEAFACLRRVRQDVRLRIVTDSPFGGYAKLADKLGISDCLDVVSCPFTDLPTSLASAHVVFNPRLECAGIPQNY